jgi:exocyst complex protein 7
MIASAFAVLLMPILKIFSQVSGQLVALAKKSLRQYNFFALSAYEGLSSLQPIWDELLSRRGSDHVPEKNELKDGLQSLRALCLRSFPEFLVDIKLAAAGRDVRGLDVSANLADFTISVCINNIQESRPLRPKAV